MPLQIDPETGQPVSPGIGDPIAPPQTIPGLSGLTDARLVGDDYQLRPFEYFRNQGGFRYAQDARANPDEGNGYAPAAGPSPGIGGGAPQVAGNASLVPTSPLPGGGAQPGGYQPGIGGQFSAMQSMLLPLLMAMMQPGIGGYPGTVGGGGYGAPRPQMPGRFAPQPTGGIARGTFSF